MSEKINKCSVIIWFDRDEGDPVEVEFFSGNGFRLEINSGEFLYPSELKLVYEISAAALKQKDRYPICEVEDFIPDPFPPQASGFSDQSYDPEKN